MTVRIEICRVGERSRNPPIDAGHRWVSRPLTHPTGRQVSWPLIKDQTAPSCHLGRIPGPSRGPRRRRGRQRSCPALALLVVGIAAGWLWWWNTRRRQSLRQAPRRSDSASFETPMAFWAARVREALIARFGPAWGAKTTEEIAAEPGLAAALGPERAAQLVRFLHAADRAKFAGDARPLTRRSGPTGSRPSRPRPARRPGSRGGDPSRCRARAADPRRRGPRSRRRGRWRSGTATSAASSAAGRSRAGCPAARWRGGTRRRAGTRRCGSGRRRPVATPRPARSGRSAPPARPGPDPGPARLSGFGGWTSQICRGRPANSSTACRAGLPRGYGRSDGSTNRGGVRNHSARPRESSSGSSRRYGNSRRTSARPSSHASDTSTRPTTSGRSARIRSARRPYCSLSIRTLAIRTRSRAPELGSGGTGLAPS